MNFSPTEEQKVLRAHIERFVRAQLNGGARESDSQQSFPLEHWKKCAEIGLQGLAIPIAYGGVGLDALSTALALEAFGYACEDGGLVFAVSAHLLACALPIALYGSDAQKSAYLPALSDGSVIAASGMTEADAGSNAFGMKSRAVAQGDCFVITGRKIFCSNAEVADLVVVYAVTDPDKGFLGGVTAFLVDATSPGFSCGQTFETIGLRSCSLGEIVLDQVRVGPDAVLGTVGGGAMMFMRAMDWERIGLAAVHVGQMERLVERSIQHLRTRTVAGKRIGEFQALSHRVADMKVRLEAARLLTYRAAMQLDALQSAGMDASIAKVFSSESLVQTATDAIQLHGGYGLTSELGIERSLRDALGATIYSGTSEIQRNMIAQWLGI